jgi:hypothetical protein
LTPTHAGRLGSASARSDHAARSVERATCTFLPSAFEGVVGALRDQHERIGKIVRDDGVVVQKREAVGAGVGETGDGVGLGRCVGVGGGVEGEGAGVAR